MDDTILNEYLVKEKAIQAAGDIVEKELKKIADVFKNFQADYLSLLNDNKRLQLLVKELKGESNEFHAVHEINSIQKKSLLQQKNSSKVCDVEEDVIQDVSHIYDGVGTPGVIERTQVEERLLIKPKNRHLNKRSNLQINIFTNNPNGAYDKVKNNSELNSKSKKECIVKMHAEMVISTKNIMTQCKKPVVQAVDEKNDENIRENRDDNNDLNEDYMNIDATLFEQPFSQEMSPDLHQTKVSCKLKESKVAQKKSEVTSRTENSPDDVVEISPTKDLLRKKKWSHRNRLTVKSNKNNPSVDLAVEFGDDDNDKDFSTPKSLKYFTAKGSEKKQSDNVAKNESILRTPNRPKMNIFSSKKCNKKLSPISANDSTFCPLATNAITSTTVASTSKEQNFENNKNAIIPKTVNKSQSREQLSDDTFFADAETCFFPNETSPIKNTDKKIEGIFNKAKRKFSQISEKSKDIIPPEMELDIEEMSDWDTDTSCDKWTSNTPQKPALANSFDTVPVKKENIPKFATKGPSVRNKAERAKLRGWDCENCEKYYENIGLSETKIQERKNKCSRHRSKFNERYNSPPGLWDLRFPDTQNSSQE